MSGQEISHKLANFPLREALASQNRHNGTRCMAAEKMAR